MAGPTSPAIIELNRVQQFIGRRSEIDDLVQRANAATTGAGSTVVIIGEPGVGKSSLLAEVALRVAGRMTVLRATGVEDEMALAWSALASLFRPLETTDAAEALTPTRRRALDAALSRDSSADSASSVDPHAVCLAVLDLVTSESMRRPILILVDDLQWVDGPSSQVLAYLGRRVTNEYTTVLCASRPGAVEEAWPHRRLDPLSPIEADLLLVDIGVSSATARSTLISSLGTNPLMLENAAGQLDDDVRGGRRPVPDPVPFPRTVLQSATRRLEQLGPATRDAVCAIAILGRPTQRDAQQMLERIGFEVAVLEQAERAGVIEIGQFVEFTHPTLRTASHELLTGPDRRRLHAVAATLKGQARIASAMHRAAATVGADEEVAGDLATAAEELVRRGAISFAADQLVRAAELSAERTTLVARRLRAIELFLDLGALERAGSLLETIDRETADGHDVASGATIGRLRARLLHLDERDDEACALLRAEARSISDHEPTEAARLLLESLAPLVREGRLAEIIDVVAALRALPKEPTADVALRVEAVSTVFAMIGAPPTTGGLEFVQELLRREGVSGAATFVAEVIAPALAYMRRDASLGEILDQVERALRDEGAIVPLISVLAAQQLRHFGARQPLAIEAGEEAIRLAADIERPKLAMMAACGLAVAASAAGDAVAYAVAADLLASSTHEHARAAQLMGLGTLHMSTGRYEAALAVWEEVAATRGFGDPLLTSDSEHVETLAKLGRVAEARLLLERLEESAVTDQSRARFHRVRGIVATDDAAAAAHFSSAIELFAGARNRIAEGRTELCWGERLRRGRRRAEARTHLQRALTLFRDVGVPTYAARAESELAATGAPVASTLPVHALLTSRELRVARLVAAGSSNREIAVELFVSRRTVETHITVIFRKLHVKNRRELAARAIVDPALRMD